MSIAPHKLPYATPPSPAPQPVTLIYLVEALASVGGTLLQVGIFFYMEHVYHWTMLQNFLLAAAQGILYILGALASNKLTQRIGRRNLLVAMYTLQALLSLFAIFAPTQLPVTLVLLLYTILASASWPALESLVSSGTDPNTMSRRIGVYNLVWAGVGALVVAVNGAIIDHWKIGVFLLPVLAHALSAVMLAIIPRTQTPAAAPPDAPALAPEPDLLRSRTLALWLSRIALPCTYVVIYSLMAMLPTLPVLADLDTTAKTAVSSLWLIARWFMFLLMSATVFWHHRPRILYFAAVTMLIAFLGVTLRPSDLPGAAIPWTLDLVCMILFQVLLGLAMGVIYYGSLYFGMVLSDGSTEHGGYHEALIGLGGFIGPGAGALAQVFFGGFAPASVASIACIVAATVLLATIAMLKARRR